MRKIIIGIIFFGEIYAQLGRVGTLLEIPVANFLSTSIPQVYISNNFSMAFNSNDNHSFDMDYLRFNIYFLDKFGAGLNFFTTREIGIDFIYNFFSPPSPEYPFISFGVRNITYERFITSVGSEAPEGGFADENYTGKKRRNPEVLSFFVVSSYNIYKYGIHFGIGRGEFVGYGPHSKYLNTDIFTETSHDLALGIFMGLEYKYSPRFNFIFEIDGRDITIGMKGNYMLVSYFLEITKLELWIWNAKNLYPRFGAGFEIRVK